MGEIQELEQIVKWIVGIVRSAEFECNGLIENFFALRCLMAKNMVAVRECCIKIFLFSKAYQSVRSISISLDFLNF